MSDPDDELQQLRARVDRNAAKLAEAEQILDACRGPKAKWIERAEQAEARLAEVEQERDALREVATELHIVGAGMTPETGLRLELQAGIIPAMATALAGAFKEHGGKNYVEFHFHTGDPDVGDVCLTMQRIDGKTPDQLKREAEAKASTLSAALERYGPLQHDLACELNRVSVCLPTTGSGDCMSGGMRSLTPEETAALKCTCGLSAALARAEAPTSLPPLKQIRQDFIDGLDGAELSEEDHVFVVRCIDQALARAEVPATPLDDPCCNDD